MTAAMTANTIAVRAPTTALMTTTATATAKTTAARTATTTTTTAATTATTTPAATTTATAAITTAEAETIARANLAVAPTDLTVAPAQAGAHAQQIWTWLGEIPDPEIPVISIVDLGIVRDVRIAADGACAITITPTYSGCPAMQVIAAAITDALHARGLRQIRLHTQIAPAWTTDWMSESGKAALKGYGIAPPAQQVIDISGLRGSAFKKDATTNKTGTTGTTATASHGAPRAAGQRPAPLAAISRHAQPAPTVACPHCGSKHTAVTSQFGSTPCKALYKCLDCREPFDYFKCH